MEAATWWISTQKLDHFKKAHKVRSLIEREASAVDSQILRLDRLVQR